MLTLRGLTLLVVAALLWTVGRLLGVPEMFVLAAASVALLPLAALAAHASSASVAVRRQLSSTRLQAHGQAEVELTLRNDSRLPATLLLVEDRCPPVLLPDGPRFVVPGLRRSGAESGSTVTLRYRVTGTRRGRHVIGPVTVRVRDPFGLVERVRRYRRTSELLVHPEVEELPAGLARGAAAGSGSSTQRRLLNTGDEFYTMREYVTGDDLRLVHWPSTAHRRKLMVRQQEMPWQARATVVLDTGAALHPQHLRGQPDATFDKAVSVAASLVSHLSTSRLDVRLLTPDHEPLSAPQPLTAMLDRLAEIESRSERSLAPLLARLRRTGDTDGLLAVVLGAPSVGGSGLARDPEVAALLAAGRGRGGRLCVIVDHHRVPGSRSTAAGELVRLLRHAGWQAVAISSGEHVGPVLAAAPRPARAQVSGAPAP